MERTEVTVHKPALDPGAIGIYLWSTLFRLLLRTTVIWGGFAILVPALGIAWYMVFIALVMLNHLIWRPTDASITSANNSAAISKAALARKNAEKSAKTDNQILVHRANS